MEYARIYLPQRPLVAYHYAISPYRGLSHYSRWSLHSGARFESWNTTIAINSNAISTTWNAALIVRRFTVFQTEYFLVMSVNSSPLGSEHEGFAGPATGTSSRRCKYLAYSGDHGPVVCIAANDEERYLDTFYDEAWLRRHDGSDSTIVSRPYVPCWLDVVSSYAAPWLTFPWNDFSLRDASPVAVRDESMETVISAESNTSKRGKALITSALDRNYRVLLYH